MKSTYLPTLREIVYVSVYYVITSWLLKRHLGLISITILNGTKIINIRNSFPPHAYFTVRERTHERQGSGQPRQNIIGKTKSVSVPFPLCSCLVLDTVVVNPSRKYRNVTDGHDSSCLDVKAQYVSTYSSIN